MQGRNTYDRIYSAETGKSVYAHRQVFFETYGWWPAVVRHSCDNPPCTEPTHLIGGTQLDNMRDRVERGRWKGDDRRGEQKPSSRLTDDEVLAIREQLSQGAGLRATARAFGVSHGTIQQIRDRKTWTHL